MFQRIIHEDWVSIIPTVSFWLLFLVFVAATARSLMMKRQDVERIAALPLDETPNKMKDDIG